MFTTASNPFRFVPALLVSAPLLLAHCTSWAPKTYPDPNNTSPSAKLEVAQPTDASGADVENPVGRPVSVHVTMIQTGPGTCTYDDGPMGCGAVGNSSESDCTVCAGPDTPLDFELTSVGCDDDLCDVVSISHGDPATGDTVTVVPHAGIFTVRATGQSGSLVASGSVSLFANCTNTPTAPNCQ